jgi:hypothetical protein
MTPDDQDPGPLPMPAVVWDITERLTLLGLLLENVGADQAVRLGNPEVWRAAVRDLE